MIMSNTVVTRWPGLMPAANVECRMYCVNGKIVSLLLLLEPGGLTHYCGLLGHVEMVIVGSGDHASSMLNMPS